MSVKVDVPVGGKVTTLTITDEMRQACAGVLAPVVETAVDLIARYEPDFQERVRQNVYLAGGGSQLAGLADAVESELSEYGPCQVQTVDDPLFAGATGALALAQDMPEEYWENM